MRSCSGILVALWLRMRNVHLFKILLFSVISMTSYASVCATAVLDTDSPFIARITDPSRDEKKAIVEQINSSRYFRTWFQTRNRTVDGFRKDLDAAHALVKQVDDPQEGLLAKLMMIRQAKYTVDLTYYIFKKDATGQAILEELKLALTRGVSVRLMVDSLGSLDIKHPTHPELKALLEHAKKNAGFMKDENGNLTDVRATVQTVVFRSVNPIQLAKGTARKLFRAALNFTYKQMGIDRHLETVYAGPNRRSHDKILITDSNFPQLSVAIIGGRNISDSYYGIPKVDQNTYKDFEIIVKNDPNHENAIGTNAITSDIADLFDVLYFHSANRLLTRSLTQMLVGTAGVDKKSQNGFDAIDHHTKGKQEILQEDMSSSQFGRAYLNEGFVTGDVDLAYTVDNVLRSVFTHKLDPTSVKDQTSNRNHFNVQLEKYLREEKKEIVLISPYLWLDAVQIHKLKGWLVADPTRRLTIITNSILTSDNMLAQTMVDAVLGPELVQNRNYLDPETNQILTYGPEQIRLLEYGRLDSDELGGDHAYGKLHAKGVYLVSMKGSMIGTFNADPRSQFLNSESGVFVFSEQQSLKMENQVAELIRDSHEWGSDEYQAIRTHTKLPKMKQKVAEMNGMLYKMLINLGLWWFI